MYKVTVFESAKELLDAACNAPRLEGDDRPRLPANVRVELNFVTTSVLLMHSEGKVVTEFDVSALMPRDVLNEYGKRIHLPLVVTFEDK